VQVLLLKFLHAFDIDILFLYLVIRVESFNIFFQIKTWQSFENLIDQIAFRENNHPTRKKDYHKINIQRAIVIVPFL
jgi:hypothetical protein